MVIELQDNIITLYGNIVDPFTGVSEGYISVQSGTIVDRGKKPNSKNKGELLEFPNCFISPGFIDNHVHGGAGADFTEGTYEAYETIAKFHAAGGTTTLLATVVPTEGERLLNSIDHIADFIGKETNCAGAQILGLHLEGPFINVKRRGALSESCINMPDLHLFRNLINAGNGYVKMITLAPELTEADKLISEAFSRGIVVSGGHTEANFAEIIEARGMGLKNLTHFYNAMKGFHHRDPGTVGAGLCVEGINLDIVPDENHVDPVAFRVAWQAKGPNWLSLITDCMSAGGMGDGTYMLGGDRVFVKEGIARLENGTLAGSTITMIQGIKYLVEKVGLSIQEAVGLATVNPARLLGLDDCKGNLFVGKDADITVFNKSYEVVLTMAGGELVHHL